MKSKIIFISLLSLLASVSFAGSPETVEHVAALEVPSATSIVNETQAKPLVQIAIMLDISGSMDGLIEQAKTELWSIVNEFIFAKRNGMSPELQISLYTYGDSTGGIANGHIKQILPLTTDLDKVSEKLFSIRTHGADEFCGWAIQEATNSLEWSDSPEDLKVIFIAGNEAFTQGPVDYNKSCKEAIAKGIIVNTIHCGSESAGINGHWKDAALLADGSFLNINQNKQVVRSNISAPQDKEIAELNRKLNDTYIAYGSRGAEGLQRQIAQDKNASSVSTGSAAGRAVAKSSSNYQNSGWDLVDAIKNNNIVLEDIKKEDLPENMQSMTIEERKAYADTKAQERAEIQKRIQELNAQREIYIQAEMKKLAAQAQNAETSVQDSLGSVVTSTIRQQAMQKNFKFSPPSTSPMQSGVSPGTQN